MSDPANFYVTVKDDARKRAAFLAGPYPTHAEALAQVGPVRELAAEVDPWSHFYAFGTAGSDAEIKTRFGRVGQGASFAEREAERRDAGEAGPYARR